jgi:peptidoglycan/LPS O-acetylase OafA/YrhL
VFWTLAVEVQFYAAVGLALLARRWFYLALAGVTAACLPFLVNEAAYRSGSFVPHWPFFALGGGVRAGGVRPDRRPAAALAHRRARRHDRRHDAGTG